MYQLNAIPFNVWMDCFKNKWSPGLALLRVSMKCRNMFWVNFSIKLVELRRSITIRHTKSIDHLHVEFCVETTLLQANPQLSVDSM